jgi:hypothetical protein
MPTETNRKLATKTFETNGGDIKVPVITEITFADPVNRGQETTYTIDNSAEANRDVHVAWVAHDPTDPQATENADPSATPPSGLVAVERIDLWRVKDPVDRGQETFTAPDNKTYNPSGPPFFRTHFKTHVVNYRKTPTDPNDTVLIASELIDEFVVIDPVNRGQETHFYLQNPVDDDEANAQITPDLPDITDEADGVDPPYRTDPFQNIVKLGGQPLVIFWAYQAESILPGPAVGGGYHFRNIFAIPGSSPPASMTLPDGRVGILTGTFPTVSDVIFNPGAGVNFLAFPWWIVGPNTDNTTSEHTGYHYYDTPNPTSMTFSHTWPFFGYTYTNAVLPAHFVPAGTLSVSFGPVAFTVDGVPWTLTNIHVSFFAIAESDFGAAPNSMAWLPYFSATFEPP